MRLAERLGIADWTQLDGLSGKRLAEWQALSLVDDWSGDYRAAVLYRFYILLAEVAAASGVKIENKDLLKPHQMIPFRKKQQRQVIIDPHELAQQHARMYG